MIISEWLKEVSGIAFCSFDKAAIINSQLWNPIFQMTFSNEHHAADKESLYYVP